MDDRAHAHPVLTEGHLKDETSGCDLPQESYPDLILTGERTLPGMAEENYWFQRHLVAYQHLLPLVDGKTVLDLGCGEGYGVDLLATRALEAVGVDLAPEAVFHARNIYHRPNLRFLYMDIYHLELEDESFDTVCSLQVIEHLHEPGGFMEEAMRVLKPGGTCVISTPNRLILSPGRDTPINPFHIFEFDSEQFLGFMRRFFAEVELVGIFHAGKLRLHDRLVRRDFSQFCLDIPPRLDRLFYRPFFVPSIRTKDFRAGGGDLAGAVDFIAIARKAPGARSSGES
jgi:SAM-dependent methyltransferase